MELDVTTVILEIINFVILVALLKHFLYRPIQQAIERRQNQIRDSLDEAVRLKAEAEAIQATYESRLDELESLRAARLHELEEDIQSRRTQALESIQASVRQEQEKTRAAWESKQKQWKREVEQRSLQVAAAFASRLLTNLSGERLETQLVEQGMNELAALGDDEKALIQRSTRGGEVQVVTAFPLTADRQQAYRQQLQALLLSDRVSFQTDAKLVAGMRLSAGNWSIGLNLQDELKGFTECIHESTCPQ
ncbi:MAG: F0F1 ATP synthase subunit delta [Hahellaceae bacterium]|nr:F0F1 ATP synthase subunit delta [Hahellaceae bacterium]